jgi:hypothetical protein
MLFPESEQLYIADMIGGATYRRMTSVSGHDAFLIQQKNTRYHHSTSENTTIMTKQPLRIGLFGFGVVGQGLYHMLQQPAGMHAEVIRVCVRTERNRDPKRQRSFRTTVTIYFSIQALMS